MIENESMTDVAYSILKSTKKTMSFYDLWDKVVEKMQFASEDEANQ